MQFSCKECRVSQAQLHPIPFTPHPASTTHRYTHTSKTPVAVYGDSKWVEALWFYFLRGFRSFEIATHQVRLSQTSMSRWCHSGGSRQISGQSLQLLLLPTGERDLGLIRPWWKSRSFCWAPSENDRNRINTQRNSACKRVGAVWTKIATSHKVI